MDVHITNTIQDTDEREWESLVGTDSIEQSYGWFRTVEDSGMRKMHYVFVKEGETLTAAACCNNYTKKLFHMALPFLAVGSPLGSSRSFFSKTREETDMLLKGLAHIQSKEKTKGLLILDLKREEFDIVKNQVTGFTKFPLLEDTYIDLNYTDFEDYLSSLNAKARRSVRITLNKAQKKLLKPFVTDDLSTWGHVAHKLQGYTCKYHSDFWTHLNEQFYCGLETHLKDKVELLLFFKDDIPLASALILNTPEAAQYKFPGIDPQYREYHAYFLLYYEGIKRAIERGQKRIYFGSTTYEFKEKIGCTREEYFGLVKMKNPVVNVGLRSYMDILYLFRKTPQTP